MEVDDKTFQGILERLKGVEDKMSTISADTHHDGAKIETWMPEAFHKQGEIGGIVVDEGLARDSDCNCVPLGEHSRLCYSKGVVGALSKDQIPLYCENPMLIDIPAEDLRRTRILHDAAIFCQGEVSHIPSDERLEPFMKCLVKQGKQHGLEI